MYAVFGQPRGISIHPRCMHRVANITCSLQATKLARMRRMETLMRIWSSLARLRIGSSEPVFPFLVVLLVYRLIRTGVDISRLLALPMFVSGVVAIKKLPRWLDHQSTYAFPPIDYEYSQTINRVFANKRFSSEVGCVTSTLAMFAPLISLFT